MISWLTGALGGAGITLPDTWDLQGIFQLVMQVLGVGFDQIMGKVADVLGFDVMQFIDPAMQIVGIYQEDGLEGLMKHGLAQLIGEDGVASLMEVIDVVKLVIAGDWGALWGIIQEHLAGLKEMVMGQIQEMIASEVIEAGVKWVLSLFNPAGAFVKACMMIYDVVQFFMERGSQIMSLVNTVIDSVTSIASGDIGGAAAAIENALASSIPVAISFLGSLLGLGDIPSRVQDIVESIHSYVHCSL